MLRAMSGVSDGKEIMDGTNPLVSDKEEEEYKPFIGQGLAPIVVLIVFAILIIGIMSLGPRRRFF